MCGIAGFLDARANGRNEQWEGTARAMQEAIHHRGPDDRGTWFDTDAGVALVHLRLSIVDLSPAGHQPMTSADGLTKVRASTLLFDQAVMRFLSTLPEPAAVA